MKPQNKYQKKILILSHKLPKITKGQEQWALKHCFEPIGRKTKKGIITCTECGESWTDKKVTGKCNCPHCGTKLTITDTRKHIFKYDDYFGIITTIKGYQVMRYFSINALFKVGKKAEYSCNEVVQRWITPDGKQATIARLRAMSMFYCDKWDLSSSLELRKSHNAHNIYPTRYYPHQRFIPEVKRSGFTGNCYDLHPFEVLHTLLSNNRAETLLKTGQIPMFQYLVSSSNPNKINNYWTSIRICIRNRYTISDPSTWCDYIDNLIHYNKDIHSPKYVCPQNLKAEHDRYTKKRREEYEREQLEIKMRKMAEDEIRFRELKANFFGLSFTDGTIQIRLSAFK